MATVITFQPACPAPAVPIGLSVPGRPTIIPALATPPRFQLCAMPPGPWYTVFQYGGFWLVQLASFMTVGIMNLIVRDQRFHEELFGNGSGAGGLPTSVNFECTTSSNGSTTDCSMVCGDQSNPNMMGFTLTSSDAVEVNSGDVYNLWWVNTTKDTSQNPTWYQYPDGYGPMVGESNQTLTPKYPSITNAPQIQIPNTAGGLGGWYPCTLQFRCQKQGDASKVTNVVKMDLHY